MKDFFFFTDKSSWMSQELANQKEFGAIDENLYRLQSTHKFSNTTQNLAIAVCESLVLIQQATGNPNLINIVLKPIDPVDWEYDGIAYFIYRGIKKESLIIPNSDPDTSSDFPEVIAPSIISDAPDLRTAVIENKQRLNEDLQDSSVLNEPAVPKHLGYLYSATADPDSEDYVPDNHLLESIFFKETSSQTFQLPVVEGGVILGQFSDINLSGFEIIGDRIGYEATMGTLRMSEQHILNVSSYNSYEKKCHKQQILNYFDAAAFYGNFYRKGISFAGFTEANSTHTEDLDGREILQNFINKNKVYIDIRHQTGYSYNFYDNFYYDHNLSVEDQLKHHLHYVFSPFEPYSQTIPLNYGASDWPIFMLDNITGVTTEERYFTMGISFLRLVNTLANIYPTFNVATPYASDEGVGWKNREKGYIKERSILVYGKSLFGVFDPSPTSDETFEGDRYIKTMHLLNYNKYIEEGEDEALINDDMIHNTLVSINLLNISTGTVASYYNIKMLIDFKPTHHFAGIIPRRKILINEPATNDNLKNSLLRHDDHILDLMFPIFEMKQAFEHQPGRVSVKVYSPENAFITSGTYGYYYDERYLPKIGVAEDDNNLTFFAYINEKDIYNSANINDKKNIANLTSFTIPQQADFLFGLTKQDLNVTLQKQELGSLPYRELIRDPSGNLIDYDDSVIVNPTLLFYLENNSINDGLDFELDYENFDCITLTKLQFYELQSIKNSEFGMSNPYRVYLGIRYENIRNVASQSTIVGRYRLMLKGVVENSSGEPTEKHVQTSIFIYTKITDQRKEPKNNYKTF